jgi:hypothetical protein
MNHHQNRNTREMTRTVTEAGAQWLSTAHCIDSPTRSSA